LIYERGGMSSLAVGLIIGAVILAVTEIVMFNPKKRVSEETKKGDIVKEKIVVSEIYGYYVTEGNETLESVAEKIYGCRECWLALYELNRDRLKKNPWKTLEKGIRLKYKKELTPEERENLKKEYMSWLRRISTGKYLPE